MSSLNSDSGCMSALIEIRCSSYLLEKYVSLEEAFKGLYYIQVRECDENHKTKGGQFMLDLCRDDDDTYHNLDRMFYTPGSSFQHFESLPIAETTNSNTITTVERLVVTDDDPTDEPSESQYYTSSPQITSFHLSNQYGDVIPTEVSNDPSKRSQGQKSSRTVMTKNQDQDSRMVTVCATSDQKPTDKMLHSIYHTLHGSGLDFCPYFSSIQGCLDDYDEKFAYGFNQYMMGTLNNFQCEKMYIQCIKEHFKAKKCPSDQCAELWKVCINRKVFGALKYSSEGLLIHSKYQKGNIGTICKEYLQYHKRIGSGGCGEVYKFSLSCAENVQLALKEEKIRPMIQNTKVFEQMIDLNSKHVIRMLEYIVGPTNEDGNQLFLFVMPYMNRGGLHVQFKDENLSCILEYFSQFPQNVESIFRNYVMICLQLLRGLQYLQKHGIVHRDIKVSNILVQQNCKCASPLQCNCSGDGGVQYVLGDLNLMCMEDDQSGKGREWEKMLQHAPAGTIGKIAPELFFKTNEGERFGSHRSDVYSACVTVMEVLVGNRLHDAAHKPIAEFFEAISKSYQAPFVKIDAASKILDQTLAKVQKVAEVTKIKELLWDSQRYIQQMQAFQGCYFSPLARILANVYGANTLHWTCLQKVPDMYHSKLWRPLQTVLNAIKDGVKFMPENRPDATKLITSLEVILPPSKTVFEKSKSKNADDMDDTQTGYIIED